MTFKKKILNSPSKACSLSIPGIFVKVFFNAKTLSLSKIILTLILTLSPYLSLRKPSHPKYNLNPSSFLSLQSRQFPSVS